MRSEYDDPRFESYRPQRRESDGGRLWDPRSREARNEEFGVERERYSDRGQYAMREADSWNDIGDRPGRWASRQERFPGQRSWDRPDFGGSSGFGRERPYGRESYGGGSFAGAADEASGSRGEADYRGRGPKGYRRNDERIKEDVCDCLTDDSRIDASNIDCKVQDGEVTVSGTVSSRDQKRRIDELCERIPGVRDVMNNVRVSREREESGSQSGSSRSSQSSGSDRTRSSSGASASARAT